MDALSPLSLLTRLIGESTRNTPVNIRQGVEIDRVLAEQEARLRNGGKNFEPRDLQVEAVKRFWSSGRLDSLRDARLVSFGLSVCPFGDSRCVMEDRRLFGAALDGVSEWRSSPRQFRKCYQGLTRSYFEYDVSRSSVPASGKENWGALRNFLNQNVGHIKDGAVNPEWVDTAVENRGLFTTSPCEKFGKEVFEGNTQRVDKVRYLIGISDGSWFTRELVMAQLVEAARREDHVFPPLVNRLLDLIAHNDVLRNVGMKLILDRYASIPNPPHHVGLKEQVVKWWGNPWLPSNTDRWGGVSQVARDMVSNWLKSEFIELFFTKLAQDGLSDTRRVRFWEKYIPSIGSMQFALGRHARDSHEKDFVELRAKLKGLLVELDDSNANNNAFIMSIGDLLAVEFSGQSNAFYGYSQRRSLPFDLSRPVKSSPVNGRNSLKNDARLLYLTHQDNIHGYGAWEDRFKDELQTNFGIKPGGKKKQQLIGEGYVVPPSPPPPRTEDTVQPSTSNLSREDIGAASKAPSSFSSAATNSNSFRQQLLKNRQGSQVVVTRQEDRSPPQPLKSSLQDSELLSRLMQSGKDVNSVTAPPSEAPKKEAPIPNGRADQGALTPSFTESSLSKPSVQPVDSASFNEVKFREFAKRIGATVEDRRKTEGVLWIRADYHNAEVSRVLKSWGFAHTLGKGWWKGAESGPAKETPLPSSRANPETQAASAIQPVSPKAALPTPLSEVFNEANLKALVKRIGGGFDDNRSWGGALWIRATDLNPDASRVLRSWGFTYKAGKGWCKDPQK